MTNVIGSADAGVRFACLPSRPDDGNVSRNWKPILWSNLFYRDATPISDNPPCPRVCPDIPVRADKARLYGPISLRSPHLFGVCSIPCPPLVSRYPIGVNGLPRAAPDPVSPLHRIESSALRCPAQRDRRELFVSEGSERDHAGYLTAMQRADGGDCGALGELIARAMYDNLNRFIVPNVAGHCL